MGHISDTRPYWNYTDEQLCDSRDSWNEGIGDTPEEGAAMIREALAAELAHRKEEAHAEAEREHAKFLAREKFDAQYQVFTNLVEYHTKAVGDLRALGNARVDLLLIGADAQLVRQMKDRFYEERAAEIDRCYPTVKQPAPEAQTTSFLSEYH